MAREPASEPGFVALGLLPGYLVAIDSEHQLHMRLRTDSVEGNVSRKSRLLRSHQGPVLGVHSIQQQHPSDPSFMTFDSTGSIMFWDGDGGLLSEQQVPIDQLPFNNEAELNELKIVRAVGPDGRLVSGDKYGLIRLLAVGTWHDTAPIKAHSGDVNDIAVCHSEEGSCTVASCGRDRSIQVFHCGDESLDLVQTIEQHSSSVNSAAFVKKGEMLLSASSDRTVGIFALARTGELKAYIALRVLTLKQTPTALSLDSTDDSTVIIATLDKQLHVYALESGRCLSTSRLADEKSGTSIMLSSTAVRPLQTGWTSSPKVVIGVSSTDKSIRIHDLESGATLLREYGHSEGVSGAAVIAEPRPGDVTQTYKLVSTGLDGTIMLWELSSSARASDSSIPASPVMESPTLAQPLRRVLSRSQLADFTKSLEASGITPLSTTPSRGPSPSRLRKRLSNYSLVTAASSPKLPPTPRLHRLERSPSPPSPATPASSATPYRKAISRTRSVGNFTDLNYAVEQLSKSLRQIRKKLAASSEALSASAAEELATELAATAKSMGRLTTRHGSVSDNVGDLLDQYTDRLAQDSERKMSLGVAGAAVGDRRVAERKESSSEFESGGASPLKLDAVTEHP